MDAISRMIEVLKNYDGPPIKIMEVCGTHTATAFKGGIRGLISPKIRIVSGPGCPVCLASEAYIGRLTRLALEEGCMIASFGDLLKVKGPDGSLSDAKARGAEVVMVYSPMEALALAQKRPDKPLVMAAVGFETTAPLYALLVRSAMEQRITNIKLLTALKRLIPALTALCASDISGFIAPGHVAAVIGSDVFRPLAEKFKKPFAVAGFTPENMLAAIYFIVTQLDKSLYASVNLYGEAVRPEGNIKALAAIDDYFEPDAAYWRGLYELADSGLYLKREYESFDAGSRGLTDAGKQSACQCARVLTGEIDPNACPMFGKRCTPKDAQGPCMVSAEGACGIWYREAFVC